MQSHKKACGGHNCKTDFSDELVTIKFSIPWTQWKYAETQNFVESIFDEVLD